MPSHLRLQSSFEPFAVDATYQTSPTLPAAKKQKMSLTRTYAVASTARSKLGREAGRADHNLRRLVGHANLLDTLMIDLADAEREQEAWFNQSVRKASPSESRHIQWFDSIQEDFEDDDSDSDSDDESDDGSVYDEDAEILSLPVRRIRTAPVIIESQEIDSSDDEDDAEYDDEDDEELALTRVPSQHSPPELALDDSDSEDESMPPSPDQPTMEFSEKEQQQLSTALYGNKSQSAPMEDYIMHEPQRALISAY
ncbi:hypothetical protein Q7P37_004163 [Cladosporium fusiforme]